jgi:3-oxoacyl-[acyl-carrier protein] reductase
METAASVQATFDLTGRVAVITGAGSGLGRASAQVLAGAGARVVCADVDGTSAHETAAEIEGAGGVARGVAADVGDRAVHGVLVDAALELGDRLDIWMNSAGVMAEAPVLDIDEEDLDALYAINMRGTLYGCQAAGRYMVEHGGGSIINMASAAMLVPSPNVAAYAMTKAAVVQLTKIMALENGKRGVRVNAIAPGFVPTKMTSRYYVRPDGTEDPEMKKMVLEPMAKFAPLRRVGAPEDIGYAVLYLASDASSFVTGQVLSPNGGVAMV